MKHTLTPLPQRILRSPITLFLAGALPIGIITGTGFMSANQPSLARGLIYGLLFGTIMYLLMRRYMNPRKDVAARSTSRTLRSGVIPTDPKEQRSLLTNVTKQIKFYRTLRTAGSLLAGLLFAFAVILYIYSETPPTLASFVVILALLTLEVAFPTYMIRRLQSLRARIPRHSNKTVHHTDPITK